MNNWTEHQIAIIYFTGLFISLITGVLIIFYLHSINIAIKKIAGKYYLIWKTSFKTTVILSGFLGAMSVSFRNCDGSYEHLLKSKPEAIVKGIQQVTTSFNYLAIILGIWFLIFIVMQLTLHKQIKNN